MTLWCRLFGHEFYWLSQWEKNNCRRCHVPNWEWIRLHGQLDLIKLGRSREQEIDCSVCRVSHPKNRARVRDWVYEPYCENGMGWVPWSGLTQ